MDECPVCLLHQNTASWQSRDQVLTVQPLTAADGCRCVTWSDNLFCNYALPPREYQIVPVAASETADSAKGWKSVNGVGEMKISIIRSTEQSSAKWVTSFVMPTA